jgi:hypothetical protein
MFSKTLGSTRYDDSDYLARLPDDVSTVRSCRHAGSHEDPLGMSREKEEATIVPVPRQYKADVVDLIRKSGNGDFSRRFPKRGMPRQAIVGPRRSLSEPSKNGNRAVTVPAMEDALTALAAPGCKNATNGASRRGPWLHAGDRSDAAPPRSHGPVRTQLPAFTQEESIATSASLIDTHECH